MSHTNAPDPSPLTPEEEALMQEQIEAAIAPYKAITPPHLYAVMRREAEEKMRAHPAVRLLLAAGTKRAAPDTSAEVPKDGVEVIEPEEQKEGA
ncbi:hypothetical protein A7982_12297 [Minicystis rosea]|nr:Hypothetical protein A7982_11473 [Minicystis rosea]APR86948.1 hypothetical protein A7982_12297 [Minicystis rosea]